jgi:hypothetical protein
MSEKPIITRKLTEEEKTLQQKFAETISAQGDLMDKMSEHLLTLELAIPGVYATVLKLISGNNAVVKLNFWFYLTFILWGCALVCTILALIPKKYFVDPFLFKQDPSIKSETLGIEDFFYQSARYKLGWIIASTLLFFVGTFCIVFTIG